MLIFSGCVHLRIVVPPWCECTGFAGYIGEWQGGCRRPPLPGLE
ncbi:hypothetical protein Pd630_LPD04745 [Rhodococcus opacus PD630]|nr:hypothetical protein Pd630_LPD04745 [Rhodococcus opacus PD630]